MSGLRDRRVTTIRGNPGLYSGEHSIAASGCRKSLHDVGKVCYVMKLVRPHRFVNRVGGVGRLEEKSLPCKLIDIDNAKRYVKDEAQLLEGSIVFKGDKMSEITRSDIDEKWAHSGIVEAGDFVLINYSHNMGFKVLLLPPKFVR